MKRNRNLYSTAVPTIARNDERPMYQRVREAIENHRSGDRSPVSVSPIREFRHAPADKKTAILTGPKCRPLAEGAPCPECDYPFDPDEWDVREVAPGAPTAGQTWKYTCPSCKQETAEVGI